MAYTIIRSSGQTITIQDGTINTTSTSLGLPGRNYAGYGQTLDTNFVRMLEHFASSTPPANPIQGQLWYNTSNNTLNVCPADNIASANAWASLTTTTSGAPTTVGNLTASGNVSGNAGVFNSATVAANVTSLNINATANIVGSKGSFGNIDVSGTTTIANITTGSYDNVGNIYGSWTAQGPTSGNAINITRGSLGVATSIKCDTYQYANGTPISFAGTYTNNSVADYLSGTNTNGTNASLLKYQGNIYPNIVTANAIAGGGTISGIWTLASGARINATYADVAERYEADATYPVGTVVELGGEKEVTVASELSEQVFGVVSDSYAYLLNEGAGTDETHPPIALVGRVKVKVIGKVKKHDRLVSAGNGFARSGTKEELTSFNSIGRSLVNKDDDGEGVVVAVVVIK